MSSILQIGTQVLPHKVSQHKAPQRVIEVAVLSFLLVLILAASAAAVATPSILLMIITGLVTVVTVPVLSIQIALRS